MKYISTRGEAPVLGFEDALLAGLARDGGLYVPEDWPTLSSQQIAGFAGRPFHEVAVEVIAPFTGGAIDRARLTEMAREAYASFRHPAVTPLVQVAPGQFILELFHGPTLAFKDVAMQLLARMMDHVLTSRGERATIVGATSGDTGGAAVEAFRGSDSVDVMILYPHGRVSDVQRRMMTTPADKNVHALAVEGTFDDCQALVKAMFTHHAFRDRVRLTGVNSINWARIVPQVTYYFVAAAALGAPHRPVSFVVPTGNFGDIFAGYVAKKMGLPIEQLVVASNSNDILPRTIETGIYEKRGVVATTSPSMDIQVSSNFERYLFEMQGRNAALVRRQMAALSQSGRFEVSGGSGRLKQDFTASAASESEVAEMIQKMHAETGYLLEPHTACGVIAAGRTMAAGSAVPQVVLSTAHPAKFAEAMQDIMGKPAPLPAGLSSLLDAPERFEVVANDLAAVEAYVEGNARARENGAQV
ncbi:MAG TPA: threonine synthase [Hyphomicrobiaceae bacterium]|nr:threonine synthase [Hyphomicrobiaceae bacterium]